MTVVFIELLLILFLAGFTALFVYTIMFTAPSVGTKKQAVEAMVRLAAVGPGDKAADLGSGDGRVVIALARAGAEAHGFEINPALVLVSRVKIAFSGLRGKAFVHLKSFWSEDLSSYSAVTVYGLPKLMPRLKKKLEAESAPGTRVVSNIFKIPGWRVSQSLDTAFLYEPIRRTTA